MWLNLGTTSQTASQHWVSISCSSTITCLYLFSADSFLGCLRGHIIAAHSARNLDYEIGEAWDYFLHLHTILFFTCCCLRKLAVFIDAQNMANTTMYWKYVLCGRLMPWTDIYIPIKNLPIDLSSTFSYSHVKKIWWVLIFRIKKS